MTMMDDQKREEIWCHSFRHLGILISPSFADLQSLCSGRISNGKVPGIVIIDLHTISGELQIKTQTPTPYRPFRVLSLDL
jgi:hypothetical protein